MVMGLTFTSFMSLPDAKFPRYELAFTEFVLYSLCVVRRPYAKAHASTLMDCASGLASYRHV